MRRNPDVLDKLVEARQYIDAVWGSDAWVELRVLTAPDLLEENSVVAYIRSVSDVDDALGKLAEFNRIWWRQSWDSVFGRLAFDVERIDAV